jgi:hypothetical protein
MLFKYTSKLVGVDFFRGVLLVLLGTSPVFSRLVGPNV